MEPFGYFKSEPFGWTDCSEDDEGAVALYEHPHQDIVKDAARYRWLRDQDWEIKRRVPLVVRFDQFNNSDDPGMNLDVIDAAIDKAMEG